MHSLLAVIALLVFPALAEARPVCGPSKARTLASNAEARLYKTGTTVYGCSRGNRPALLGTKVTGRELAGHYAVIVNRGALRFYNLLEPSARHGKRLNAPDGKVRGLSVTSAGAAAWIEDGADGGREVRASGGATLDTGSGIAATFVHVAGPTVSWRKSGYVRLGSIGDARDAPESDVVEPLGTVLDVELSYDARAVIARYKHGSPVKLGDAFIPNSHEDDASGIDAIRVSGSAVAVRDNLTVHQRSYGGELRVHDLARGTERTPCKALAIWNFVVTAGGSAACSMVVDTLGGTSVNRIVAEDAVLDEGDQSVRDLAQRGSRLVWRHGDETRTAPLPAPQTSS